MRKINRFQKRVLNDKGINIIKISKSKLKTKQKMVTFKFRGKTVKVHFGDPKMKEYPGTKRGDNYCNRSYFIKTKTGQNTRNNPLSANFWSRLLLWNCKGKKSMR